MSAPIQAETQRTQRHLLTYQIAAVVFLAALVLLLWPPNNLETLSFAERLLPRQVLMISPEVRLLIVLMLCGAIGSFIQSLFSMSLFSMRNIGVFVEEDMPASRVVAQYTQRAVLGGILAVGVYFANRAAGITSIKELNITFLVAEAIAVGTLSNTVFKKMYQLIGASGPKLGPTIPAEQSTESSNQTSDDDVRLEAQLLARWTRSPRNRAVADQLISIRRRLGKYEEAAQIYDTLLSNDPENVDLIQEKAALYLAIPDQRRYVETLEQAERIRAKHSFEGNIGKTITLLEVEIRDLHFFGDFKWKFQPTVNVLLGKNGYGKTHLLRALVAMLQNQKEVTNVFLENSGKEPTISVVVNRDGETQSSVRSRLVFDKSFGKVPILAIPDMRYVEKSNTTLTPGTPTDLRSQGADHFMREESYKGLILSFLYDICIDYFDHGKNFNSPIFQLMQKTVQELTGSTFAFRDIVRKNNGQFDILVLTDGNELTPLPLQKVSQGTLSVLTMVGLTYRFLKSLYPRVSESDLFRKQAIVVIDEIDAHLHPAWQQKILQLFRDTFPNIQFIVTAHTPLVVGGCKEHEVAVLRKSTGGFVVEVLEDHFIGATATSMYEQIFQVEDKDITFLRLNTLLGTKEETERKVADLEEQKRLSPEQESELRSLRDRLHYLRVASEVGEQRRQAKNLESQRQTLELETMNLRGEVNNLKSRLESKEQLDEMRDVSGLINFIRGFVNENPRQSGFVEPFIRYLSRSGGYTEAASLLETLIEIEPKNSSYFKGLAVQYQSLEKHEKARDVLRRAAALFPEDEEIKLSLLNLERMQRAQKGFQL